MAGSCGSPVRNWWSMAKDIRGWSLSEGDTVAYAVKPGRLVTGTVLPLGVDEAWGGVARELYVRIEGPTGRVLKFGKETVKVGGA